MTLPLLLVLACNDHAVFAAATESSEPTPDSAEPPDTGDSAETDSAATGRCEARTELGYDQGFPIQSNPTAGWGTGLAPALGKTGPEVWVQYDLCGVGDAGGMFTVDNSDWAQPTFSTEGGAEITCGSSGGLHRGYDVNLGSRTVEPGLERAATLFWGKDLDEPLSSWLWVSGIPELPVELDDVEGRVDLGPPYDSSQPSVGDLDGDGLDDLLFAHLHTPLVFTAPFLTPRVEADADASWTLPDSPAAGFGMTGAVVADLDGDGHLDLLWSARDAAEQPGGELAFVRGPFLQRTDWSAPDGLVHAPERVRPGESATSGPHDGLVVLGEVTDQGHDAVAVAAGTDEVGEPGSDALFVMDRALSGSEELTSFTTRLVGPAVRDDDTLTGTGLVAGPSGDFNADGHTDILAYHRFSTQKAGNGYQAYLLPGPVEGTVSLLGDSIVLRLAAEERDDPLDALLVPDLTGDGTSDLVLSTNSAQDGTVWMFPGCEAW